MTQTMASPGESKSRSGGDLEHRPRELDRVKVEYGRDGQRAIRCFCGERVNRSIVRHFRDRHATTWRGWVDTFVGLRAKGYPLKKVMRTFKAGDGKLLFSWTVVEREVRKQVESGAVRYKPPPKLKVSSWSPSGFEPEKTTIWDFPRRGDWAVHSGDYRGNWAPQVPRNLIERYTDAGDLVVDAFCGGGTTLIEAWLMGRRSIGLDISKLAIQTTRAKLREMQRLAKGDKSIKLNVGLQPKVLTGDALRLDHVLSRRGVEQGSVRLLCAHPPYLDSLTYTGGNGTDLSRIHHPSDFYDKMAKFARAATNVLRPDGRLAVLIGDVRKNGSAIPLADGTLHAILDEGFVLEATIIKSQHRDRSSEFYYARDDHYLLMAHEYLYIARPARD